MHLPVNHGVLDGALDTQVNIAVPVGVEGPGARVVEAGVDLGVLGSRNFG